MQNFEIIIKKNNIELFRVDSSSQMSIEDRDGWFSIRRKFTKMDILSLKMILFTIVEIILSKSEMKILTSKILDQLNE